MIKQLTAKLDGRNMEDEFEIVDAILEARGIEDIEEFLRPEEDESMVPIEQLKGAEEAAQAIIDAIDTSILRHRCTVGDDGAGDTLLQKL